MPSPNRALKRLTTATESQAHRILWREWRLCDERDYANQLYPLVAETQVGSGVRAFLALLAGGLGLFLAMFIGLLLVEWSDWNTTLIVAIGGVGQIIGGSVGFWAGQGMTWRIWLENILLETWYSLLQKIKIQQKSATNPPRMTEISRFKYMVIVTILRASIGLMAVTLLAIVVELGLVVYMTGSHHLSRPELLAWGIAGMIGAALVLVPGQWITALVGFFRHKKMLENRVKKSPLFDYRHWFFWWRQRPVAIEIETALQTVPNPRWKRIDNQLRVRRENLNSPTVLIKNLSHSQWSERFLARHTLVYLGGEAVQPLTEWAQNRSKSDQKLADWLLRSISSETHARYAADRERTYCPSCLLRFAEHDIITPLGQKLTYLGCRGCGQSREFFRGNLMLILDSRMQTPNQETVADTLRVNWLKRKALFDFDAVEIVQANSRQLDQFITQLQQAHQSNRNRTTRQGVCNIHPKLDIKSTQLEELKNLFRTVIKGQ